MNKQKKSNLVVYLVILGCYLFTTGIYAQGKTISGIITDPEGIPLPGASIVVKGTQNGVATDFDGNYTIDAQQGDVLVISSVGFKNVEKVIGSSSTISVQLEMDSTQLDEVVVIGYGQTKKSDVTGAIVSVGSEELNSRPVNNAVQGLQGKAAGVDITSNERPGTVGEIRIRGVRSLSASNSPLYVVDGIPLNTGGVAIDGNTTLAFGGIETLNPNDIESIDVLKDASATAIYGSRGANGVIIITTKSGRSGRLTFNYSASMTLETLQDSREYMDAGEYIEFRRWSKYYSNPNQYPRGDEPTVENDFDIFLGASDPSAWQNISNGWENGVWDPSKVKTTKWRDIVTQTGITDQHTLSVSGGTEKIKAYGSVGYLSNTGTVKGQGYKRYTAKTNIDVKPTNWFKFGASINLSYEKNEFGQSTSGRNSLVNTSGLYDSATSNFPYTVPFDSQGNRIEFPGGDVAVKTVVNEWEYSQDQRVVIRAFGSLNAELNFGEMSDALKGLKYRVNFGPDLNNYRQGIYIDGQSVIRSGSNYAALNKNQATSYTLDNLLYYDRTFGNHLFGVTLLQSQTEFALESSGMAADNIPFSDQKWNALSASNVPLTDWSSDLTEKQLLSYMARVNYGFDDRYLITLSGRYDGASQLSEGNKWSFFPSAALGWRIDKESFMADKEWIDQLKLRAGVGVTGNSAINPYSTQGGLTPIFYPFGTTSTAGSLNSTTLANPDLSWEKTTQYNFGLDFIFWRGRVSGALDYYTSNTDNLLLQKTIPTVTGYVDTYANVGETASQGIDLTLNTVNIESDMFSWETTFNGSWQDNHIVSLASGTSDDINNGWFIGESQSVIYGYANNGLWQEGDADEIAKFNANGENFSPGNVRPVDQNGDYIVDANNDRVIIGSTIPKFIVGLTNTFKYQNLELSVFLYGRMGYKYDTGGESQTGRFNQREIDYYTEINTDAEYQKPIYTEGTGDPYAISLGYRNADFLKIRNISLGYNFPRQLTDNLGLSSLKLYLQVQNPGMIFSKIEWMDMDLQRPNWNRGFTTGVNVSF